MELKIARKKGFGLFRGGNQKNRSKSSVGIGKANGIIGSVGGVVSCTEEDGAVRMKIVVKKSDLKQLIELMNGGGTGNPSSSSSSGPLSLSAEQRLNTLRKKHISRANALKENRRDNCWTPALQSIPEELSP